MAGSTLNREDYKTAIPQLSSQMKEILDNNVVINRTVINLTEGKVSDLNSYLGYFQSLTTGYFQAIAGDVQFLSSRQAYLGQLKADIAGFGYLTAETADLRYATIQNLTAATARISDLEADHVSVTDLTAATGRISALEADHVSTSDLAAVNADVSHLKVGDLTIGGVTVNIYDLAMAIKSDAMASGTTWYKVSATTPSAPTGFDPTTEGWSQTEPAYVAGTTNHLYSCLRVVYADDDPQGTRSYQWSDVHLIQSWEAAKSAYTYADDANTAADSAMKGLGQVEDVVGTLNWITEHSKVTTDITPQAGKSYYIKNQDNTFTLVTDVEGKNPAQEGWYELTEAVQNYILSHLVLMNDGLYVMADDSHWKVRIADDGVYIIDDTNGQNKVVAKYKNAITLGNDNGTESYQRLDYHSLKLIDKEGNTYFHVSDLRDASGKAEIVETTHGDGATVRFDLSFPATGTDYSVTVNGVTATNVRKETTYVTFTTAPSSDDVIAFTYDTSSNVVKAFTFGGRRSGVIGALSTACGQSVLASGYASHAEGDNTTASGYTSHAEGFGSIASGSHSHAEGCESIASGYASHAEGCDPIASGYASHAEGGDQRIASGLYSHAEGLGSTASGRRSHAQNRGTVAGYDDQTAIGKYNDNQTNNAFEIGNGTDNHRSNAFEVDWSGNVNASGDIEDGQANVLSDKADISSLAAVATSGRYDDLANKPLIPSIGIGSMMMYAGTSAPDGWLMCSGQAVSRTKYARLFDVIGTTYGSGDGSTTFNLPDLRNRFPVGVGSSYNLNAKGGANTVTLGIDEMPAHTHDIHYVYYNRGSGSSQTFGYLCTSGPNLGLAESRGGGKAHENRPPYIALNFIIYAG